MIALSRIILETSARVWRLASHKPPDSERIERYLAELYGAYQAERMERAGGVALGTTFVSVSSETVIERIEALDLSHDDSRSNPTVGSQRRPDATDLVPRVLGDGVADGSRLMIYRLGSAVCHGHAGRAYDVDVARVHLLRGIRTTVRV